MLVYLYDLKARNYKKKLMPWKMHKKNRLFRGSEEVGHLNLCNYGGESYIR